MWFALLRDAVKYACIMHCTFEYVGDFVVCDGPSMEPTLYSKNILLTERLTRRLSRPDRGNIIIAISPTNPNQFICKRIIGLPGDKIITKLRPDTKEGTDDDDDEIFVDYFKNAEGESYQYVPKGCVWIEGDNTKNSSDSRDYGPLPMGLIQGRVLCRLWPFSDMCLL